MMVRRCAVPGCNNTQQNDVSFYSFPKDEKLKRKWVQQMKQTCDVFEPTRRSYICSDHFAMECFEAKSRLMFEFDISEKIKHILKWGSVPSIFTKPERPGSSRKRKKVLEQSPDVKRQQQQIRENPNTAAKAEEELGFDTSNDDDFVHRVEPSNASVDHYGNPLPAMTEPDVPAEPQVLKGKTVASQEDPADYDESAINCTTTQTNKIPIVNPVLIKWKRNVNTTIGTSEEVPKIEQTPQVVTRSGKRNQPAQLTMSKKKRKTVAPKSPALTPSCKPKNIRCTEQDIIICSPTKDKPLVEHSITRLGTDISCKLKNFPHIKESPIPGPGTLPCKGIVFYGSITPKDPLAQNPFSCKLCGEEFMAESALRRHSQSFVHTPFKCDVCGNKFSSICHMSMHVRLHSVTERLQCLVCNKKFPSTMLLTKHYANHVKVQCFVCGLDFQSGYLLHRHIQKYFREKRFRCASCSKSYASICNLVLHMKTHHLNSVCELCGPYDNPSNLMIHVMAHLGFEYECMLCGGKIETLNTLVAHIKAHMLVSYSCILCGNGYPNSSSFDGHLVSHAKELPFSCIVCGMGFVEKCCDITKSIPKDYPPSMQMSASTHAKNSVCSLCGKSSTGVSSCTCEQDTWKPCVKLENSADPLTVNDRNDTIYIKKDEDSATLKSETIVEAEIKCDISY